MKEKNNQSEIILYKTDDGRIKVDTVFQSETIWLTQAQMSELFDVKKRGLPLTLAYVEK